MKFLAIFTLALATQGALASEVGTKNPNNVSDTDNAVNLALADNGASSNWTTEPLKFEATAHQKAELEKRVNEMNAKVAADLDAIIAQKLERALAQ